MILIYLKKNSTGSVDHWMRLKDNIFGEGEERLERNVKVSYVLPLDS